MRPRVFPAEDAAVFWQKPAVRRASMRPRVFPAEDTVYSSHVSELLRRFNEAAGIPRGRHLHDALAAEVQWLASMRPRVFPAEDALSANSAAWMSRCFNEAAGIPRGRRVAARKVAGNCARLQ